MKVSITYKNEDMRTDLLLTELESALKEFIAYVERIEHIRAIKKKIKIEILSGYITLSVDGEFYNYSGVFDGFNNMKLKGLQYNPL